MELFADLCLTFTGKSQYVNNGKGWSCYSPGHAGDKDPFAWPNHDLSGWLYGQLLIIKPLDSFCLYLVRLPSWLWVSAGLQKGLFPYWGRHSLHPWRDKSRRRLSVLISQQTAAAASGYSGCFVVDRGGETKIKAWLQLNLDLKRQRTSQA